MNSLKNKSLLIIDENPKFQDELRSILENMEVQFSLETQLKSGLNKALSSNWDLVILNSIEEAGKILDLKRALTIFETQNIPVIIGLEDNSRSALTQYLSFQKNTVNIFDKGQSSSKLIELINETLKEHSQLTKFKNQIIKTSSVEKPTVVKVLALFLFLEPLIKIIYFQITTQFSFIQILDNISKINHPWEFFEFWLLYPLGGLALLSKWSWSFLLFIGVQLLSVFLNLSYEPYTWPYIQSSPHISSVLLLLINFLIIYYFFSKQGRQHFLSKKGFQLRGAARYPFIQESNLRFDEYEKNEKVMMQDLSLTGTFITTKHSLFLDDRVELSFPSPVGPIDLEAQVVNKRGDGYGLRFIYTSFSQKKLVKAIIKQLSTKDKI